MIATMEILKTSFGVGYATLAAEAGVGYESRQHGIAGAAGRGGLARSQPPTASCSGRTQRLSVVFWQKEEALYETQAKGDLSLGS